VILAQNYKGNKMTGIEMIQELKKYNPYTEMVGICEFRKSIMYVELDILPDTEYLVKDLIRDIEAFDIKEMKLYDYVREEIGDITGIEYGNANNNPYDDWSEYRLTFIYSMVY
jgi:hypothetical protein